MMVREVDYDDQPENAGGGKFLNLKAKGDKINIRLAAKPITYFVHWVDSKPLMCEDKNTCKTCQELAVLPKEEFKKKEVTQKKRRQTYVWPVIDRADGQAKIFKGGVQIFVEVGKLAKNPKWGGVSKDATKFDIEIERTELSLQNFYSVVPDPDSKAVELTAEEKQAVEKLGPLVDTVVTGASAGELADGEPVEVSGENSDSSEDFIQSLESDRAKSTE